MKGGRIAAEGKALMAGTARIRHRSPVEWLKNVRVFETVPDDILKRIYGECHLQTMERGEPLFKAGDEPNSLFILTSGRVRTSLPAELGKSEVGPGCVLGEAAFLTRVAHQATVTAVRSSIVLKLEWDSFQVLAEGAPEVWQAIIQALVRLGGKVAAQPAILASRARTIALCPAGDAPMPPDFVDRLGGAMEERAECQFLSSEGLGQNLPGGIALDDPQVVHWLKEQETRFDVIVLIADAEPTQWTQKTLAEADEICLVATHDGGRLGTPVPLGPVEELAFETRGAEACRLALFHDPKRGAGQTAGTRRWLEYRPVRAHHHLRPGQPADFQRLARFLLSQSTGLFATAPGAFGAVTLGIYKAVQAAGFEIDCFAGTGAGAAMAACLALGMDPDDIDHLVTEIMVQHRALRRRNWPVFSLYDQRAFDRLILKHFPDVDVTDMPVPFYAASINLSSGREHLHTQGNVQVAVRANWPFPGLLPPFIDDEGQMLIDGSALAPPPLDPLRRMNAGPNVVARAAIKPFGKSPVRYRDLPQWQQRARHWLPWRRKLDGLCLPSFESFLAMTMQRPSASEDAEWLTPLDMLMEAPIPPRQDVLAWRDHGRLKDMAYQWALQELEKRATTGDLPLTAAAPTL